MFTKEPSPVTVQQRAGQRPTVLRLFDVRDPSAWNGDLICEEDGIYRRRLSAEELAGLSAAERRALIGRGEGRLLALPCTLDQIETFARDECILDSYVQRRIHLWRVMRRASKGNLADEPARTESDALLEPALAPPVGTRVREVEPMRAGQLEAVIRLAIRQALNPQDWSSVWNALVRLAERRDRPEPLIGYVEDEGIIKYRAELFDPETGGVAILTREAFRKRFSRRRTKPAS